jgi:hypothetical protein
VLLAADLDLAGAAQRRRGDGFGGIAIDKRIIRQHHLARRPALLDGDVRRFGIDLDLAAQRRPARRVARGGNDGEHRLLMKQHLVLYQDRLIAQRGRHVVLARYIRRGDDGDHARRRVHAAQIDAAQPAARHRCAADGDMQRADGLGDIVDIFGAALHMLGAAVVRQRLVDMAQRRLEHVIRRHRRASGDRRCGSPRG